MKPGISIIIIAFFLINCKNDTTNNLNVNGSVKNVSATTIYLEETALGNAQPVIIDSTQLDKDGSFKLEALTKEESIYNLRLDRNPYPFVSFINDSKLITINADFANQNDFYTVKGSKASEALKDYLSESGQRIRSIYNINIQIDSLQKLGLADSIVSIRIPDKEKAVNDLKTYTVNVISNSSSPSLAMFALGSYQSLSANPAFGLKKLSPQEIQQLVEGASKKFPQHSGLASIKASVQPKAAPSFTLPDTSGRSVSLTSFKGKYVLVDFWASWCKPCREENPNVVNAYRQFKDKNFTILGVSLDREKNPWLQAIKQDSLSWTHVSDLKFWESIVVPMYGIQSIPYNVLLDPQGTIVAENLRGPELRNRLSEILK